MAERLVTASVLWILILFATAGAATQPADSVDVTPDRTQLATASGIEIEIIESAPLETELDQEDIRNTSDVWVEMIEGAGESLDLAEFYLSNTKGHGLLEPVIEAVTGAAGRGVKVRLLVEKSFYDTYPETIDRLGESGIEVRFFDIKPLTGGVLHAKYFIVDGRELFLGSQNFDWRALEHIHEIGLRVVSESLALTLVHLFEFDWALAGGEEPMAAADAEPAEDKDGDGLPDGIDPTPDVATWNEEPGGGIHRAYLVASPPELNPQGIPGAEDELIRLIDSAEKEILVQLLSYSPAGRRGGYYATIDNALRAAANRGVKVRMILSDWNKRRPGIDHLKSLSLIPNIYIRLSTIPQWSEGFIPFARVEHCKYMVVDEKILWVGTSNWSEDYFHSSRNVEMVVEAETLAERMWHLFYFGWNGPYTYPIRVDIDYPAPRIR
ncbi:MAG: phospholipase [Candidatus Eisenbacteria sp.]|nr:phospholipase [Candidatus Eisenbacteria bacterium]